MGKFQKSCALALIVAFGATSAVAVPVTGTSDIFVDQTLITQAENGAILVRSSPADSRRFPDVKLPRRIRDLRDQDEQDEGPYLKGPLYLTLMDFRCMYLERLKDCDDYYSPSE